MKKLQIPGKRKYLNILIKRLLHEDYIKKILKSYLYTSNGLWYEFIYDFNYNLYKHRF